MSVAVHALGFFIGSGGRFSPILAANLDNASSVAVVAKTSRLNQYQIESRGLPPSARDATVADAGFVLTRRGYPVCTSGLLRFGRGSRHHATHAVTAMHHSRSRC
jgi:hypothetical protein